MALTLKIATTAKCQHDSGSQCCITILNSVTKCSVVQKVSSGQTFTDISNLRCDLDLEYSNPIFPQDIPVYDAVLASQVWLQTNQQFRRYNRNSHNFILIIQALAVNLTLNTVNQFFCMTLWLMILHTYSMFGNKMFCGSEDIVQTNIH